MTKTGQKLCRSDLLSAEIDNKVIRFRKKVGSLPGQRQRYAADHCRLLLPLTTVADQGLNKLVDHFLQTRNGTVDIVQLIEPEQADAE